MWVLHLQEITPPANFLPTKRHDHYDRWLSLWQSYQQFYKTDIPAKTIGITWSRLLSSNEPMGGAVALIDGRIVGITHYIFHRSCWTIEDSCYLQDLYVDETARRRGIARRLIDHVCDRAAEHGCSRVHWLTHHTNADAMRLYDQVAEKSGFVQYRKSIDR